MCFNKTVDFVVNIQIMCLQKLTLCSTTMFAWSPFLSKEVYMYNLTGIVLNRHFLSFLSQDECLLI